MENNINIEDIMAQIRDEIKEKGLSSDMLSFEDVPYSKPVQVTGGGGEGSLAEADEALAFLNANYYVQPYKPLPGNPIKVFIKKVIRKLTKFYVEPVVFEQNSFNAGTVNVLNVLRNNAPAPAAGVSPEEVAALISRIETLELANKELRSRLDALERKQVSE